MAGPCLKSRFKMATSCFPRSVARGQRGHAHFRSYASAWLLWVCCSLVSGCEVGGLRSLRGGPRIPGLAARPLPALPPFSQQVSGGCTAAPRLERAASGDSGECPSGRNWGAEVGLSPHRTVFSIQAGPCCQPLRLRPPYGAPRLVVRG